MASRYWVGGSGTWDSSNTSNWSTISGGSSGASAPAITDNVIFDTNSFSANGQTVTINANTKCSSLDLSLINKTVTFNYSASSIGTNPLLINGNLIGCANVTWTLDKTASHFSYIQIGNINGSGSTSNFSITLQSNGMIFGTSLRYDDGGTIGSLTLLDNLTFATDDYCGLIIGGELIGAPIVTFNANGFNINATWFFCSATTTSNTVVINMGAGIWTFSPFQTTSGGFGAPEFWKSARATINASTSKIVLDLTNFTGTTLLFSANSGKTFYDFTINGASVDKTLTMSIGSATFNNIIILNAKVTIKWQAGTTIIMNSLTANGTSGNLITFISNSSGVEASISANVASVSYIDVMDNHALGAGILFDDTLGGVDSGNNTNWLFLNLPSYPVSIITAIARVQQGLAFPKFIMGGKDENDNFMLFKKGTSYTFSLARSDVYKIGEPFKVKTIRIPLSQPLATNEVIVPVLWFDSESNASVGTLINTTNYATGKQVIILTEDNFRNKVAGNHSFFLELRFTGSALIGATFPISVEVEKIYSDT